MRVLPVLLEHVEGQICILTTTLTHPVRCPPRSLSLLVPCLPSVSDAARKALDEAIATLESAANDVLTLSSSTMSYF